MSSSASFSLRLSQNGYHNSRKVEIESEKSWSGSYFSTKQAFLFNQEMELKLFAIFRLYFLVGECLMHF